MARVSEDDLDRLAEQVGLRLDPADRLDVAVALAVLLRAARLVMEFPLPEDVHPAPVFRP
jgi:Protein of unknown function (DUF4089)